MLNQYQIPAYITGKLPQLRNDLKGASLTVYQSVQVLTDYTKRMALEHDFKMVEKCMHLVEALYKKGNTLVRNAVENVFIFSYNVTLQHRGMENSTILYSDRFVCAVCTAGAKRRLRPPDPSRASEEQGTTALRSSNRRGNHETRESESSSFWLSLKRSAATATGLCGVPRRVDNTKGAADDQFFIHLLHGLIIPALLQELKFGKRILLDRTEGQHDSFPHLNRQLLHRVISHQLILSR